MKKSELKLEIAELKAERVLSGRNWAALTASLRYEPKVNTQLEGFNYPIDLDQVEAAL